MSIVDSRIVQMVFDNKQFESGVHETMGTLDKLKKGLDFSGAIQGFADISKAASKIDFSEMAANIETIASRFTPMGIIATEVLERIGSKVADVTGKIVNFGKELSFGQISDGWKKYADKTTAVQTIMAATAEQFNDTGEQMDYVNSQLDKLNWFTDETSYNFVDMVGNIGKFTSNGIALDSAVTSMQGIANWAAISGQNAATASRAMYNLAQAIGVGSVKLIDWRSIENANMATQAFKKQVIETAVAQGKLKDKGNGTYKVLTEDATVTTKKTKEAKEALVSLADFNSELSKGWFDKDVLTTVLNKYGEATDKLYELSEASGSSATDILAFIEAEQAGTLSTEEISKAIEGSGMSVEVYRAKIKELASEQYKFGIEAFKAAQEAKTFSDAIEATKDAVSTGWMNTFEIIFGDYETARHVWTDMANNLWDIFASGAENRNNVLEEWASTGYEKLIDKIKAAGVSVSYFENSLGDALKNRGLDVEALVKEFDSLDNAMASGAIDAELLSNAVKDALDQIIEHSDEAGSAVAKTEEKLAELQKVRDDVWLGKYGVDPEHSANLKAAGYDPKYIQDLVNKGEHYKLTLEDINDEQLTSIGLTEEEIKLVRELQNDKELLMNIQGISGREMFLNGINNTLQGIASWLQVIKDSFNSVFGSLDSKKLTSFSAAFEKFSQKLVLFDEKDNLTSIGEKVSHALTILLRSFKYTINTINILWNVVKDFIKGLKPFIDALSDVYFAVLRVVNVFKRMFNTHLKEQLGDYSNSFKQFGEIAASGLKLIIEFLDKIASTMAKDGSGIDNFLLGVISFVTYLISYIKDLWNSLTGGKTFIEWLRKNLELLGPLWEAFSSVVFNIYWGFRNLVEIVEKVLSSIFGFASGFNIIEIATKILEFMAKVFEKIWIILFKINNYLLNNGLPGILEGIWSVIQKVYGGIKNVAAAISNVFRSTSEGEEKLTLLQRIGNALTKVWEKLKTVLAPAGDLFKDIWENIKQLADPSKITAGGILKLAASFKLVQSAIKGLKSGQAINKIGGLFGSITDIVKKIKNGDFNLLEDVIGIKLGGESQFESIARAIKTLAISLLLLGAALIIFSLIDPSKAIVGLEAMLTMLAMAGMFLLSFVKGMQFLNESVTQVVGAAVAIGILAAALILLGVAIAIFIALVQSEKIEYALLIMAEALGAVTAAILLTSLAGGKALAAAAAIAIVAVALILLGAALAIFVALVQSEKIGQALEVMVSSIIAVVAAIAVLSIVGPMCLAAAVAIGIVAVALIALAVAVGLFTAIVAINVDAAAAGLIMMVSVLAAVVLAIVALSLVGPAALIAAGTLLVVAVALDLLAIAAIGFSVAIAILGAGLILIGVGIAAIGAGIALTIYLIVEAIARGIEDICEAIGNGSEYVKTAAENLGAGIKELLTGIAEGVEVLFDKIGEGIGAGFEKIGEGIGNGIAKIGEGIDEFGKYIGSVGNGISQIGDGIEDLGNSIRTLNGINWVETAVGFSKLAGGLKDLNKQKLVGKSEDIVGYTKALQGLANMADNFKSSAEKIVTTLGEIGEQAVMKFVTSIANHYDDSKTAGNNLAVVAINAISAYQTSFEILGGNIAAGLANGMYSRADEVKTAASYLGKISYNATAEAVQSHSPSRLFAKLGEFIGQGLANGMVGEDGNVANAAETMISKAIKIATESTAAVVDSINSSDDMVLTPILDLSNIRKGANELNSMLDSSDAIALSASISRGFSSIQNGGETPATVTFDSASLAALNNVKVNSGTPVIKFEGSLAQLAAVLHPYLEYETNRIGPSAIRG